MTSQDANPLSISVVPQGPATVLVLAGSADVAEVAVLREHVEQVLAGQQPVLVLDLTDLAFIGSLGLGLLVEGHRRACDADGDLRLVNPNPRIQEVLEMTRLTTVLPVFASVQEAMQGP